MSTHHTLFALVFVGATACGDSDPPAPDRPGYAPEPQPPPPAETLKPAPTCKDTQKRYAGFGGAELTQTRLEADPGFDRARAKPFGALADEYRRVLGVVPASLANAGSTFGEAPARWYAEPKASGVSLYTAYRVAFDGCLVVTSDPKNAARFTRMPDPASAGRECAAWARAAWSRSAALYEIDACVSVATTASLTEPTATVSPPTTPQRRWAYTCASVLTAAGFLTY